MEVVLHPPFLNLYMVEDKIVDRKEFKNAVDLNKSLTIENLQKYQKYRK